MTDDFEILSFKVIIIGNSKVGKTSILNRFIYNSYKEDILSTTGINFADKKITLQNGKSITLKLFDTAGQERFRALSKSYFRNVDAALFVFAANNENSFQDIREWITIFMNCHTGKKDIPLYLVENKNDLEKMVDEKLINNILEEYNFKFKSTCAKSDKDNSINELFHELSEILYKNSDHNNSNKKQKCIQLKIKQKKYKIECCRGDT